jgi:hypothetical protein
MDEQSVGILFDEKIVGVWFLSTISDHQDWMAAVREIEPDKKYELTYRFRYYTGDQTKNPFDDGDRKSWYKGQVSGTRAYVVASIRMVAKELERRADGDLFELMNDGDLQKMMRKFADMPFVYAKAKGEKDNVPTPHPVQD